MIKVRGPFGKFVDSPYYSESNFLEVRWRSVFLSTSFGKRCTSYNSPHTYRKRATDRWSLGNFLPRTSLFVVGEAQKSHGARYEFNSVFGLEEVDRWNPIRTSAIQSRSRHMRCLGFSNHEKGAPMQEISKWWTVCSTFSRSGWSVVRSASLSKGGTSKKRPSPQLFKVPTRSNKVSPRTLQTAVVFTVLVGIPKGSETIKWILGKRSRFWRYGMDSTGPNKIKRRSFLNMLMDFLVTRDREFYWSADHISAFQ
jgi:hypothetical protein